MTAEERIIQLERELAQQQVKNVKLQAEDAQLYLQVEQVSWQARLLPNGGLPSEAALEQKANKSKRPILLAVRFAGANRNLANRMHKSFGALCIHPICHSGTWVSTIHY